MFIHPLARTDQHLIQDFMLTKVALLLARHAEHPEWVFELKAMDDKSREGNSRGHAFLFIYTVARYVVAVARARVADASVERDDFASDASPFVGDFTNAVAANDPQRALGLWVTSPFGMETDVAAPATQKLAFEFLDRLSVPAADVVTSNVADFLPDPFASAAAADAPQT